MIIVLSVLLPVLFYLYPTQGFDTNTVLYNYLSISVVAMSAGWFIVIQNLEKLHTHPRFTNAMKELSVMSFGIYLVHIFVMRRFVWKWISIGSLPLWLEIIVVSVVTTVLSYSIIKVISLLPFKKYIIG